MPLDTLYKDQNIYGRKEGRKEERKEGRKEGRKDSLEVANI
jgi:hypothetical protein